jgi:hypothetical protein
MESKKLVISETATSNWFYHLRLISESELRLTGGAGDALCGAKLGWDTQIPLTAWGKKNHVPSKWCKKCFQIANKIEISNLG